MIEIQDLSSQRLLMFMHFLMLSLTDLDEFFSAYVLDNAKTMKGGDGYGETETSSVDHLMNADFDIIERGVPP